MLRLPQRGGWRWRLVTLTLTTSGNLRADYERLRECWNKLRGKWKRRHGKMIAGVAAVEVGARANVHVHLCAYLPWIDQAQLSTEWLEITGDSKIVDVRLVRDGLRNGLREVGKYLTKLSDRAPSELVHIYRVFRGKQTHRPWGALHGQVHSPDLPPVPCTACGETKWWPIEVVDALDRAARGPP